MIIILSWEKKNVSEIFLNCRVKTHYGWVIGVDIYSQINDMGDLAKY